LFVRFQRVPFQCFLTYWRSRKVLVVFEQICYNQPLRNLRETREIVDDIKTYYFMELPYSAEKEWADYLTNNALTLKQPYDNVDNDSIKEIIENIGYNFNAKFEIISYNEK
jgi:hypothetical protein